jgi:predicted metalloendopeptidase
VSECVANGLSNLTNRQYLARYFSANERSKGDTLVAALKSTFIQRLQAQDWMDAATKGFV